MTGRSPWGVRALSLVNLHLASLQRHLDRSWESAGTDVATHPGSMRF